MSFRFRKRFSLGPLRINVTKRGISSVALKVGPVTRNLTRRRTTVDLPGEGLYWQHDDPR
jgi:hypothetical protein